MPEASPPSSIYWKRKLAAFLHDSPEKVLSILDHEARARRIAGEDWTADEKSRREADWAASAADRLPFPPSGQSKTPLSCFRHPLSGQPVPLNEDNLPVGAAEETSQVSRPRLQGDDPRQEFIATWRFWRNWAASRHPDFALYPAETRLPDHTIWNHLAVTSALQGCLGGSLKQWIEAKQAGQSAPATPDYPCFLLFSIGPVQDFIAAARSTRDLWSGSYLLSYLIATVLKRVSLDFGPDHVIFPNLCDQPLIDLLLKADIWDQARTSDQQSLFEAFGFYGDAQARQRLLTPTLPNRFLAILPAKMAEHRDNGPEFASVEAYASNLAASLRTFVEEDLAAQVRDTLKKALPERVDLGRFDQQVKRLLEIHWQILPWPGSFADAQALVQSLPADDEDAEYTPRAGLETIQHLCRHGADSRYLIDGQPRSAAAAWSALYGVTDWLLDGAKATRSFAAQTGGHAEPAKTNTKDSLNGKDEAVLIIGDEEDARNLSAALEKHLSKDRLLKKGEALSAATLIKRLWPFACLCKWHSFDREDLAMPNTHSMAAGQPWADSDEDDSEKLSGEKYFAVLALDGDSMGKWISGSKGQPLAALLSEECQRAYPGADLAGHKRPLSPSWHLQFSEALGNFSLHAVRRVVEVFDGRLIYSGGDDVLAMLPANRALECAEALRLAFRGDPALNQRAKGLVDRSSKNRESWRSDQKTPLFAIETPGFLKLAENVSTRSGVAARLLDDPVHFPVIVPGSAADCSIGIAIAHFKSPLQDVVKAAQAAEKRAKNVPEKAAVAVSLFKRSGEITEWAAKWEHHGIELYQAIAARLDDGRLSAKFPHRVCQLLEPHLTSQSKLAAQQDALSVDQTIDLIQREFAFAIDRQSAAGCKQDNAEALLPLLKVHLTALAQPPFGHESAVQALLRAMIGLCTTVAFAHRTRSESKTSSAERQSAA
jgi:CRISPR-associated protein Cmr2